MRHNKSYIIKRKKYYNIITSLFTGIITTAVLFSILALCVSITDISDSIIRLILYIILSAGGFITGFKYGKFRRRKGIKGGLFSGLIFGIIIMILVICLTGTFSVSAFVKNMLFVCISGTIGGVYGVNTKIRQPPP